VSKPEFHKKTLLRPLHHDAQFCSTCHKVRIPLELSRYKEFLPSDNHFDSYRLSDIAGHNSQSFYNPPKAIINCSGCHMPLEVSEDSASADRDGSQVRKIHSHLFPGGNTALPWLLSLDPANSSIAESLHHAAKLQAAYLSGNPPRFEQKLRIDIFGLKEGGTIDGKLIAPLRPELPALVPGQTYLFEIVIRTLNMGHAFTEGTAHCNETWVDFKVRSGNRIIARSGAMDAGANSGNVDGSAHFVNVLMLDRYGRRISPGNPHDLFTPLYNHQIPPGAAQVVHYAVHIPSDIEGSLEFDVKLRYRKFAFDHMALIFNGRTEVPCIPVVDICADRIVLPVRHASMKVPKQTSSIIPAWQRWNDYGIGCFLEGGFEGKNAGELRQADEAFQRVVNWPDQEAQKHGYLNLVRVYYAQGLLAQARTALKKAREANPPAQWWSICWFEGLIDAQQGQLDGAISNFEWILDPSRNSTKKAKSVSCARPLINFKWP
jgi:hypothetical protein